MQVVYGMLILLTAIAGCTDLRYHRIPNWLSVSGLSAGLIWHMGGNGLRGVYHSLSGAGLGFGIMLLLYVFKAVGAGDVKLFAAIGAIGGPDIALSSMTYSLLCAGGIGVVILVRRKRLLASGRGIWMSVMGFLFIRQGLSFDERLAVRFPFMAAVLPGMAAAIWEIGLKGAPLWMQ